ncbi:MAG: hypothetical protein WCH99_03750 [Verrucomicrobiota bacterium]
MPPIVRLNKCLWIHSRNVECQSVFKPLLETLAQRDIAIQRLEDCATDSIDRVRELVWKTDQHVILHGLLASELNALRPVFERRKNFSILPIDWWNTPSWYPQNATYYIFYNYNGIAVRTQQTNFLQKNRPPWLFYPDRLVRFAVLSALLRPPALAAAPLIDLFKNWQRHSHPVAAQRLLYFPFAITKEQVPLQLQPPRYDYTNMGATNGPWLMRDPYAPAWLNFANLYCDRQRLLGLMLGFEGKPFTIFDRRRNYSFLPWEELNHIVRQSRFMICTGGLHQNSVPKFLEYACLGVPMIGALLPFEYPWLDDCLFSVDAMNISASELKLKLAEALDMQPKLHANCLAWRDRLLKMYHPDALLDLLQDQMDGKPIPPGYLKVSATTPNQVPHT